MPFDSSQSRLAASGLVSAPVQYPASVYPISTPYFRLFPDRSNTCQIFTRNTRFNWIWQLLTTSLIRSTDPKVVWKNNRQGKRYLQIYDVTTEKQYYFESEQEARIWLEKRYSN
jgi:hypothetical protein